MNNVQVIEYEDRYHAVFKSINEEWLDLYNLKEEPDLVVLNDPKKTIIENKGVIYLARYNGEIIGSAALIREHDGVYELAKMAVAKNHRQMGVGKMLIEKCLEKAAELGAKKIVLFSNHQLKAALALYEKYGFRYIPLKDSPFATADIKMELLLR